MRRGNRRIEKMRLRDYEIIIIKDAVHNCFGSLAKVSLFGSRLNDSKKGGDIDLLVEIGVITPDIYRNKIRTLTEIQMKLGEQKIDLIVTVNPEEDTRMVVKEAIRTGREL
jgi:predicted nucleotidyltransferase